MRRNVDTYARNLGKVYVVSGSKEAKTAVPVFLDTFAPNDVCNLVKLPMLRNIYIVFTMSSQI